MQTKPLAIMLICGTLMTSPALSEEAETAIPDLEKVKEISLWFETPLWVSYTPLWYVRLFPDGSGHIIFVGGGLPVAIAFEGIFSFEEIYNLLAPNLKPNQEYIEDIKVGFSIAAPTVGHTIKGGGGWLEDRETIRKLMHSFRDKMEMRSKGQFEEIFVKRPLVWGDDLDGNPIPGYVRTPYVKMVASDPFADDSPAPKDGNAENATPQEARKTGPDNGEAQTPLPDREAVQPDSKVATASLPLADEAKRLEAVATMDTPPSRLWLYVGILSTLCAGVALWLIRRKK